MTSEYIGFRGMTGVHLEISAKYASFLIEQLELYLTFKLADDPEQPSDQMIAEFFRRYYGPAVQVMSRLYHDIEDVFTTTLLPKNPTEELTWGDEGLGRPERMAHYLESMADAVAATGRSDEKLAALHAPAGSNDASSVEWPSEDPTAYEARVDLFRRGVWNYMFEGYSTYWGKHPEKPRLPLLRPQLRLLESEHSSALAEALKQLPWPGILCPFSYGPQQEFGEALSELLPPPSPWQCTVEHGGVLIISDRDHAFHCDVARRIGKGISAKPAIAGKPVRVVEVQDSDLVGDDWQDRLFAKLTELGLVDSALPQAPAMLVVGWTRGFQIGAAA